MKKKLHGETKEPFKEADVSLIIRLPAEDNFDYHYIVREKL